MVTTATISSNTAIADKTESAIDVKRLKHSQIKYHFPSKYREFTDGQLEEEELFELVEQWEQWVRNEAPDLVIRVDAGEMRWQDAHYALRERKTGNPAPPTEEEQAKLSDLKQQLRSGERSAILANLSQGRILLEIKDSAPYRDKPTAFKAFLKSDEVDVPLGTANRNMTLARKAKECGWTNEQIGQFSQNAFLDLFKFPVEIAEMVGGAISKGRRITKKVLNGFRRKFALLQSNVIPDDVKIALDDPNIDTNPEVLEKLGEVMEILPEDAIAPLQEALSTDPSKDRSKEILREAKAIASSLEASKSQSLSEVNIEGAIDECGRLGLLGNLGQLVRSQLNMEKGVTSLWKAICEQTKLSDRLYSDTGASNPYTRKVLTCSDVTVENIQEKDAIIGETYTLPEILIKGEEVGKRIVVKLFVLDVAEEEIAS